MFGVEGRQKAQSLFQYKADESTNLCLSATALFRRTCRNLGQDDEPGLKIVRLTTPPKMHRVHLNASTF